MNPVLIFFFVFFHSAPLYLLIGYFNPKHKSYTRKQRTNFHDLGFRSKFLYTTPKAWPIKEKREKGKLELIKIFKIFSLKTI